jgi:manganese transport protein
VADVLLILLLQARGFRYMEALIVSLMLVIGGCFIVEIALSNPDWAQVAAGFVPSPQIVTNPAMLYVAIGILGATVMPHNLYLHSALVQTRDFDESVAGRREAVHYAIIDSTLALLLALLINASILIVARRRFMHTATRRSPRFRMPIRCWRRCWARARPACCSRWRCSLRDRIRPSPARSPGRS